MFPPSSSHWEASPQSVGACVWSVCVSVCVTVNSFYHTVLTHTHPGMHSIYSEIKKQFRTHEAGKTLSRQVHKIDGRVYVEKKRDREMRRSLNSELLQLSMHSSWNSFLCRSRCEAVTKINTGWLCFLYFRFHDNMVWSKQYQRTWFTYNICLIRL